MEKNISKTHKQRNIGMSTSKQIKELSERKLNIIHEQRSILNKIEAENRSANDSEKNQIAAQDKDLATLDERISNLSKLFDHEQRSVSNSDKKSVSSFVAPETEQGSEEREAKNKKSFAKFLRTGVLDHDIETRAIGVGSAAVGTRDFFGGIVQSAKAFNAVMKSGAEVLQTSSGTDFSIMCSDDTGNVGQLLGENTEETNMTDATLTNVILKAYKFSSKMMRVSLELFQDAGFDVEGYVAGLAGERIGRSLNSYFTTGTGSSQPKGVVAASSAGKTAASTTTFTADELLDFVHSIDPAYRDMPGFRLMMHDTVLAFIRKFKDSQNRYLIEYGTNGAPDKILGYNYVVNNDMDSAFTTGKKLVLAGDFSRYKIRLVNQTETLRLSERYAEFGQVGFISFVRADANLADSNAIKHFKLA